MGYNVYVAEYKMAIVEGYLSSDVKVRDFVKEKKTSYFNIFHLASVNDSITS